jgi:O-antigen/teichoic acid export membrane protein
VSVYAEGASAPSTLAARTARTSGILYASSVLGAALGLGNVLVTARVLGPEGRGAVAFLTTVATLTSALSVFGVQQAVANSVARRPERSRVLAGTAAVLSAGLGLLGAAVVALLVQISPGAAAGASRPVLTMVLASVPLLVLQICLQQLVASHSRFGVLTASLLLPAVVNLAGNGVLAVLGDLTTARAVGTWLLGQLLATVLLVRIVLVQLGGVGRPSVSAGRAALAFGVKAHLGRVMMLSNYRLDQWLLGALAGTQQLGLYSVAVACADAAEAGRQAADAFRAVLLVTVPLMAALALLAPVLSVTLLGSGFASAVTPLRILVLGAPGVVALKLLGSALTAQGLPLREAAGSGTAFATLLTLDLLLIPPLGGLGAACASTAGYTAGGLVAAAVFVRTLDLPASALLPRSRDVRLVRKLMQRKPAPAR